MKTEIQELIIEGKKYISADSVTQIAKPKNGMQYVLVRSRDSGVHAGYQKCRNSETSITLVDARRIHYWEGAASLSQLACDGVSKPEKCRFAYTLEVEVIGICEVLTVTDRAKNIIEAVELWTK
jgi:hypothetical protein